MNILIDRNYKQQTRTISQVVVDGKFFCYSLEDRVRPADATKVPGETAIPPGKYKVRLTWSPAFRRLLPRVIDVPGFVGILFHGGNTEKDVKGCIAVANHMDNARTRIYNTEVEQNEKVTALDRLIEMMRKLQNQEADLEIL